MHHIVNLEYSLFFRLGIMNSMNRYLDLLSTCYVLSAVLSIRTTVMNKIEIPAHGTYILVRENRP